MSPAIRQRRQLRVPPSGDAALRRLHLAVLAIVSLLVLGWGLNRPAVHASEGGPAASGAGQDLVAASADTSARAVGGPARLESTESGSDEEGGPNHSSRRGDGLSASSGGLGAASDGSGAGEGDDAASPGGELGPDGLVGDSGPHGQRDSRPPSDRVGPGGQRELRATRFGSGARRTQGSWIGDVRDGPWREWWETGSPRSEGDYHEDQRVGTWTSWHPGGGVEQTGAYDSGLRDGVWLGYHPGGAPLYEGTYTRGRQESRWVLWYSNGQVREEGTFVNGLREGEWQFFDSFGRVNPRRSGRYVRGQRVSD